MEWLRPAMEGQENLRCLSGLAYFIISSEKNELFRLNWNNRLFLFGEIRHALYIRSHLNLPDESYANYLRISPLF